MAPKKKKGVSVRLLDLQREAGVDELPQNSIKSMVSLEEEDTSASTMDKDSLPIGNWRFLTNQEKGNEGKKFGCYDDSDDDADFEELRFGPPRERGGPSQEVEDVDFGDIRSGPRPGREVEGDGLARTFVEDMDFGDIRSLPRDTPMERLSREMHEDVNFSDLRSRPKEIPTPLDRTHRDRIVEDMDFDAIRSGPRESHFDNDRLSPGKSETLDDFRREGMDNDASFRFSQSERSLVGNGGESVEGGSRGWRRQDERPAHLKFGSRLKKIRKGGEEPSFASLVEAPATLPPSEPSLPFPLLPPNTPSSLTESTLPSPPRMDREEDVHKLSDGDSTQATPPQREEGFTLVERSAVPVEDLPSVEGLPQIIPEKEDLPEIFVAETTTISETLLPPSLVTTEVEAIETSPLSPGEVSTNMEFVPTLIKEEEKFALKDTFSTQQLPTEISLSERNALSGSTGVEETFSKKPSAVISDKEGKVAVARFVPKWKLQGREKLEAKPISSRPMTDTHHTFTSFGHTGAKGDAIFQKVLEMKMKSPDGTSGTVESPLIKKKEKLQKKIISSSEVLEEKKDPLFELKEKLYMHDEEAMLTFNENVSLYLNNKIDLENIKATEMSAENQIFTTNGIVPSVIVLARLILLCSGCTSTEEVLVEMSKGKDLLKYLLEKIPISSPHLYFLRESVVVVSKMGLPRLSKSTALLEALWDSFYIMNLIDEASFTEWYDDDSDDTPGRMNALFQVMPWLQWLFGAYTEGGEDSEFFELEETVMADQETEEIDAHLEKREITEKAKRKITRVGVKSLVA
ncbi:hypothetical protein IE077_003852 [Cardiosporidium cionae]|uniref:W2 domain-containing protein n=1 Tax=Cardiosporidium cionae TaxID=476202 RepID=A0ABQ7JEG5_9APIC|nr:hypothetical protein IE077_003852 [Cardiosporidium cionae]|eukprot:KAF8822391.1 hypothetical protein IE077_003852 [Cardiosporidium cionae]